jgi:hypothetical protein
MNRKIYFTIAAAMLAVPFTRAAKAQTEFFVEANPTWARPTTAAQAGSSLTTYQGWNDFNSTQSPSFQNPPNDPNSINPSGTPVAFDNAYPGDGAFFIGSGTYQDIYSFSGVLNPQVIVPQYSITGQQLNVLAQIQYFGQDINLNDLLVTYTDANGVQQSVQADTLANYSVTNLYSSSSEFGGFGVADEADYEWAFTVPNTSTLQLSWGWDVTSSALQDIAVDTQSVPVSVPEPASVGLLGLASSLLLRRARRSVRT